MKFVRSLLAVLAMALVFASCTKIPAGYVGLKIDLMGDGTGAVTEVPPGWKPDMSPSLEYKKFPQFIQTYGWTEGKDEKMGSPTDEAIRFQTSEGMQIVADVGVTFALNPTPGSAKALYLAYRGGIEEFIDGPLRNAVRDSLVKHGAKYTADQVIGEGKTPLIEVVQKDVTERFSSYVVINTVSWLASPRPPQQVIDALNAKVQATQLAIQKENEVRSAKAEAEKEIEKARGKAQAIYLEAEAQAKANKLLNESLTGRAGGSDPPSKRDPNSARRLTCCSGRTTRATTTSSSPSWGWTCSSSWTCSSPRRRISCAVTPRSPCGRGRR